MRRTSKTSASSASCAGPRAAADARRRAAAWKEHNLSQLRHFASLPLPEKMRAVEGMADVVRRLLELRGRGRSKRTTARG